MPPRRHTFVVAGQLRTGERLKQSNGTLTQVTRITPLRGPPVMVYNLEIDGEHVYHVGGNGLLVHNNCPLVDLTDFRKDHILNRHRSGTGISGKTEFPASWSDEEILHHISDVATDPKAITGMGKYNSPGRGGRQRCQEPFPSKLMDLVPDTFVFPPLFFIVIFHICAARFLRRARRELSACAWTLRTQGRFGTGCCPWRRTVLLTRTEKGTERKRGQVHLTAVAASKWTCPLSSPSLPRIMQASVRKRRGESGTVKWRGTEKGTGNGKGDRSI